MRCLSHILGMVQWYHAETPTSNWTKFSYAKKEQYRAWQGSRPRRAVQRSLKRPWNFHSDLPLPSRGNPTHWLQPLTRHHYLHQHNTRYASSFVVPPHHLSQYKKKSFFKGANYFNHQPKIKSLIHIKIKKVEAQLRKLRTKNYILIIL